MPLVEAPDGRMNISLLFHCVTMAILADDAMRAIATCLFSSAALSFHVYYGPHIARPLLVDAQVVEKLRFDIMVRERKSRDDS